MCDKICTRKYTCPSLPIRQLVVHTQRLVLSIPCTAPFLVCIAAFGGPLIVSKGAEDVMADGSGKVAARCTWASSPKRSGGQGDVLAGEQLVAF